MYKKFGYLSLIFLLSCADSDMKDTSPCVQKFIVKEKSSQRRRTIYYDVNGKIKSITDSLATTIGKLQYSYDVAGKLRKVESVVNNKVLNKLLIYFDNMGRFSSYSRGIPDYFPGDSLAITYGADGKTTRTNYYSFVEDNPVLSSYDLYSYPDAKTVTIETNIYFVTPSPHFESGVKVNYSIDDKPLPYPAEYYYGTFFSVILIIDHNILSFNSVNGDGYETSYDFPFNYSADGYPLGDGQGAVYSYSCNPQLEP